MNIFLRAFIAMGILCILLAVLAVTMIVMYRRAQSSIAFLQLLVKGSTNDRDSMKALNQPEAKATAVKLQVVDALDAVRERYLTLMDSDHRQPVASCIDEPAPQPAAQVINYSILATEVMTLLAHDPAWTLGLNIKIQLLNWSQMVAHDSPEEILAVAVQFFEHWKPITRAVREAILPSLSEQERIILAWIVRIGESRRFIPPDLTRRPQKDFLETRAEAGESRTQEPESA